MTKKMTSPLCDHCRTSLAIYYGVPTEAALSHAPDGTVLDSGREMMFAVEPQNWMRLCGECADTLIAARHLVATFDLATWKDPRLRH